MSLLCYADHHPTTISYPVRIDLREDLPPASDQGRLGSCTGHAVAAAMRFANRRLRGNDTPLSSLFVYWHARAIEGGTAADRGARMESGIKAAIAHGACPDDLWPHRPDAVLVAPPDNAVAAALPYRVEAAYRITTLTEMLSCLTDGWPFLLGFHAFEAFEGRQVAESGRLRCPTVSERSLGGHAVLVVGFDLCRKTFIARNHWGPSWGEHGHFALPFAYATNPALAGDLWAIRG